MQTYQANLLNSLTLILFGIWGYIDRDYSVTALIPVFFGILLLLCNQGIKKENKIISHIAVAATLLIVVALFITRMEPTILEYKKEVYNPSIRLFAMLLTGTLAMIAFIKSFIQARKKS
mgnify:FL=1|tara:strand:+ start:6505 stop:6861 length:357 start_codon:yes stop_codon:yes gene_type:complete